MIVSIHKKDDRTVVSIVDDDIIDKKFLDGDKQLDLTAEFYKGKKVSDSEAGDLLRNSNIVHLVGKNSVKLGIDEGIITEENIVVIAGIPQAQAVVFD